MSTPSPNLDHRLGLSDLARVSLAVHYQQLLAAALATCGGPTPWRRRKAAEARDLLALAQLSRRLVIHGLDLTADLRALVDLIGPVPVLDQPDGPLTVLPVARLGLVYRQAAMVYPQPGYSFVQILAPARVWHSNVSHDGPQVLCLGPTLPAGLPVREIVLMTYAALSLQTVQFDVHDAAGLANSAAADFFQRNSHWVPLTTEPFLAAPSAPHEHE